MSGGLWSGLEDGVEGVADAFGVRGVEDGGTLRPVDDDVALGVGEEFALMDAGAGEGPASAFEGLLGAEVEDPVLDG